MQGTFGNREVVLIPFAMPEWSETPMLTKD